LRTFPAPLLLSPRLLCDPALPTCHESWDFSKIIDLDPSFFFRANSCSYPPSLVFPLFGIPSDQSVFFVRFSCSLKVVFFSLVLLAPCFAIFPSVRCFPYPRIFFSVYFVDPLPIADPHKLPPAPLFSATLLPLSPLVVWLSSSAIPNITPLIGPHF